MIVQDWTDAARLTVIVGHFGSGKTEISLNLAMVLANRGHPVALADLDIVDPYFRSRECKTMLEECGGRLIASSQACLDADVPSMPPEVTALFDNRDTYGVLDIGGDASGARVLARYRKRLEACAARVLCVINANRPLTDSPEKAESYIHNIELASGLHIGGLINNTHLCDQTNINDVIDGAKLVNEVAVSTGIPVICHAVSKELLRQKPRTAITSIFPIDLYMKKPWEYPPQKRR